MFTFDNEYFGKFKIKVSVGNAKKKMFLNIDGAEVKWGQSYSIFK